MTAMRIATTMPAIKPRTILSSRDYQLTPSEEQASGATGRNLSAEASTVLLQTSSSSVRLLKPASAGGLSGSHRLQQRPSGDAEDKQAQDKCKPVGAGRDLGFQDIVETEP